MAGSSSRSTTALIVLVAAVALAGCMSQGDGAPESAQVEIVDFGFDPSDVEVASGGTVTWTHTGDATHTITWTSSPSPASPEDSGDMTGGDTYELSHTGTGTFEYECRYHPGQMQGSVTFV